MPETIGHRLKSIRLSRQLSLEKAAEATRVRAHFLQALENDDLSTMSSTAQARGFLRLYADFLGLDLDVAMIEMRQTDNATAQVGPTLPPVAVVVPPAPEPAAQPPPASVEAGKPGRHGFWSRLIRRSVSETPAGVESAPSVVESPVVADPAPDAESQPEPAPSRTKKSVSKKPKVDRSKNGPIVPAKTAGKKKAPLKTRPKR